MEREGTVRRFVITGASASGKDHLVGQLETAVQEIAEEHHAGKVSFHVICTDMFYHDLSPEDRKRAMIGEFDFDTPNAIDSKKLMRCIEECSDLTRTSVELPVYNFAEHRQTGVTVLELDTTDVRRIVVIQGIFPMCFPNVREISDMSVFLETSPDVQVIRRIQRDTVERGRNIDSIVNQYTKFVKPGFELHVKPTKDLADLPMQYNSTNPVVVETIALQLLYGRR